MPFRNPFRSRPPQPAALNTDEMSLTILFGEENISDIHGNRFFGTGIVIRGTRIPMMWIPDLSKGLVLRPGDFPIVLLKILKLIQAQEKQYPNAELASQYREIYELLQNFRISGMKINNSEMIFTAGAQFSFLSPHPNGTPPRQWIADVGYLLFRQEYFDNHRGPYPTNISEELARHRYYLQARISSLAHEFYKACMVPGCLQEVEQGRCPDGHHNACMYLALKTTIWVYNISRRYLEVRVLHKQAEKLLGQSAKQIRKMKNEDVEKVYKSKVETMVVLYLRPFSFFNGPNRKLGFIADKVL